MVCRPLKPSIVSVTSGLQCLHPARPDIQTGSGFLLLDPVLLETLLCRSSRTVGRSCVVAYVYFSVTKRQVALQSDSRLGAWPPSARFLALEIVRVLIV